MKCHICGKEMRIVHSEIVQHNDTVRDEIDTWRCDDCDSVRSVATRAVMANWRALAAILIFAVFVILPFVVFVWFSATARIP